MIRYGLSDQQRFIVSGLFNLRVARDMIKAAGNKQAIKAVRRAIKSTEGAFRHLDLKLSRKMNK